MKMHWSIQKVLNELESLIRDSCETVDRRKHALIVLDIENARKRLFQEIDDACITLKKNMGWRAGLPEEGTLVNVLVSNNDVTCGYWITEQDSWEEGYTMYEQWYIADETSDIFVPFEGTIKGWQPLPKP